MNEKGDALELTVNKLGAGPLENYHYDIFQVPEDSDSVAAGEKFQFEMNKKGDIDRVSAPLEPSLGEGIVFTRALEKIAIDVLQSLSGEYVINGQAVSAALIDGTLLLTVAGQPR